MHRVDKQLHPAQLQLINHAQLAVQRVHSRMVQLLILFRVARLITVILFRVVQSRAQLQYSKRVELKSIMLLYF